ncbi:MAG: helix-turn-helix transcriptional regulator [Alphaproteobacteria bacterium]
MENKDWRNNLQETKDDIGRQLNELRRQKRLTLQELSEQVNLPQKVIERIELGLNFNMDYNNIHCLARFYGQKIKVVFEKI